MADNVINAKGDLTTAAKLLKALEKRYGQVNTVEVIRLKTKLLDIRLKRAEKYQSYFDRFDELVTRLAGTSLGNRPEDSKLPKASDLFVAFVNGLPEDVYKQMRFFPD